MEIEDCILLRDEPVDSGSINRCIENLNQYVKDVSNDNNDEISENYPDKPFYKDGEDSILTSEKYSQYNLQQSSPTDFGLAQRLYSGPLQVSDYKTEACSTMAATGFYEYSNINDNFIPTVNCLYSNSYPLIFASLLDDESKTVLANGTYTIPSTYLPLVKYTSYLLCSGLGVSFGTINCDRTNGNVQENKLHIDVIQDLIHLSNVKKVHFITVSNGYSSGIEKISEDYDMIEDINSCSITFLNQNKTEIFINNVTKNDYGEKLKIETSTGRILGEDEEAVYGNYIELDNTSFSLNFFILFDYTLPTTDFSNETYGLVLNGDEDNISFTKYMQNVLELNGEKLTLPNFEIMDSYTSIGSNNQYAAQNIVVNISYAFDGCKNALFTNLSSFSNKIRNSEYCFRNCENADFKSLSTIEFSHNRNASHMFENCKTSTFSALESIYLPNSLDNRYMFSNCLNGIFDKLYKIEIGGNNEGLFNNCKNAKFSELTSIGGTFSNISNAFSNCTNATYDKLKTISSSYYATINVNDIFNNNKSATFKNLETVILGKQGFNGQRMFKNCSNATFAKLCSFEDNEKNGRLLNGESMFENCSTATFNSLYHIGNSIYNAKKMFYNCSNSNIKLTYLSIENVNQMFSNCSSVKITHFNLNNDGEPGKSNIIYASKLFENSKNVVISDICSNIISGDSMFENVNNVSISSGNVFNIAKNSNSMFKNVTSLSLGAESDNKDDCAENCDSMFYNVTSKAFSSYKRPLISYKAYTANSMYELAKDNVNDNLFNSISSNNLSTLFCYTSSYTTTNGTKTTLSGRVIEDSNLTSTNSMFSRRDFKSTVLNLFKNYVPYDTTKQNYFLTSDYILQIPKNVVSANSMYAEVDISSTSAIPILINIPSSLKYANYMFYHSSLNLATKTKYYLCSNKKSDGVIYFSDELANNHTDWFKNVSFSSLSNINNGNYISNILNVANLSTDYFAGSDYDFSNISDIIDRSNNNSIHINSRLPFFTGISATPRNINFCALTSDISKWFDEGVDFVNLLTPYTTNSNNATKKFIYSINKNTNGKTYCTMNNVSNYSEHVSCGKYTQGKHFCKTTAICGDNITCMFAPDILSEYSKTKFGDKLNDIMATDFNTVDFYMNNSYPNTTFNSVSTIETVNMPFAFYGLKNAEFKNLHEIKGNMSNGALAFADCVNSKFNKLSSIRITSNYTPSNYLQNSFTSNTKDWHNKYFKMFYGCTNATFDSLCDISIKSASNINLDRMFYNTALSTIPNIDICANGNIYARNFKRYYNLNLTEPNILKIKASNEIKINDLKSSIYFLDAEDKRPIDISFDIFLPYNTKSVTIGMSGRAQTNDKIIISDSNSNSETLLTTNVKNGATFTYTDNNLYKNNKITIRNTKVTTKAEYNQTALTSISITDKDNRTHIYNYFNRRDDGLIYSSNKNDSFNPKTYVGTLIPNSSKVTTISLSSISGLIYAGYMLRDSAQYLSSISFNASGNIYVDHLLYNSNIYFTDKSTISILSKNGVVNAAWLFYNCKNSTLSSLTDIRIDNGIFAYNTLVSSNCANNLFYNCSSATLQNLSSLYIPSRQTSSQTDGNHSIFNKCNSLNLASLKIDNTNLHCCFYDGDCSDGSVIFDGINNLTKPTRKTILSSNLNIDKDIIYAMNWSNKDKDGEITDALISTNIAVSSSYLSAYAVSSNLCTATPSALTLSSLNGHTMLYQCNNSTSGISANTVCISGLNCAIVDFYYGAEANNGTATTVSSYGLRVNIINKFGTSSGEQIFVNNNDKLPFSSAFNSSTNCKRATLSADKIKQLYVYLQQGSSHKTSYSASYCKNNPIKIGDFRIRHTALTYKASSYTISSTDEYNAIDAITTTNGYIDTNIVPDENTKIEFSFLPNLKTTQYLFGCKISDSEQFVCYTSLSNSKLCIGLKSPTNSSTGYGLNTQINSSPSEYCTVICDIHPNHINFEFQCPEFNCDKTFVYQRNTTYNNYKYNIGEIIYNAKKYNTNIETIKFGRIGALQSGDLTIYNCIISKRGKVVSYLVPVKNNNNCSMLNLLDNRVCNSENFAPKTYTDKNNKTVYFNPNTTKGFNS